MATELIMQKNADGRLMPVDGLSAEVIDTLPIGKPLGVTIKQKRNLKHHKKYWALVAAVWPHQGLYPTKRRLSKGLLKAVGHTDDILNLETLDYDSEAASIAFDSLDQEDFQQVYERVVEVVLTRILPGVNREDLDRQVQEILQGRGGPT